MAELSGSTPDRGSRRLPGRRGPDPGRDAGRSRADFGLLIELKSPRPDAAPTIDAVIAEVERVDAAAWTAVAGSITRSCGRCHERQPSWTIEMIYSARLADPSTPRRPARDPGLARARALRARGHRGAAWRGRGRADDPAECGAGGRARRLGCDVLEGDDVGFVISSLGGTRPNELSKRAGILLRKCRWPGKFVLAAPPRIAAVRG